nr:hypothetical protein K-LCC10_0387 [Kaumoebavirus]
MNAIPIEIQAEIFSYLSTIEKLRCSLVNKKYHSILLYSKDSALFWKVLNANVIIRKHRHAFENISPEVLIDMKGHFKSSIQHYKNLRELKISYQPANCVFTNLQKLIIKSPQTMTLPVRNFPKLRHLVIMEANIFLSEIAKLPLLTLRICGRLTRMGDVVFPTLLYLEIRNFQRHLQGIEAPELIGIMTKTIDHPTDEISKKYEKLEYANIVDVLEDNLSKEAEDLLMEDWREKYTSRYDAGGILDPFEVKGHFYI